MEDYLEAILEIAEESAVVGTKAIADKMGVRQPSVTSALRSLVEKGLIAYEPYGAIVLTKNGRHIAEKIWQRHVTLRHFLHDILGVEKNEANEIACELEHVVSENVMDKLVAFTRFIEEHEKVCRGWDKQKEPKALSPKAPSPKAKGCAKRAARMSKSTKENH